jgi:hypothetical protein
VRRRDRTGLKWAWAGTAHFDVGSTPFLEPKDDATLSTGRRRHWQKERDRFAQEAVHKLERKKRKEIIREKDRSSRRKQPQVVEDIEALPRHPRRRRKTPSELSP